MFKILRILGIALLGSVILVSATYLADIQRAYARVNGKSSLIPSPYGDIEYLEGGRGPAVLVIHGSGGGYDQGELIAEGLLGEEFHWIAPSRFGYLRSTFHSGATFEDQARTYAALLDHLGIQKVAVVAMSAGGPSAELFALLYPERVSSLTLLSCAATQVPPSENKAQADQNGNMLAQIVKYDLPYWMVTRVFENQFMSLMGANEAVIASLSPQQRDLVRRAIDDMNPVSRRAAGVEFDHTAYFQGDRLAGIRVPTLILHAADDTLQPYYHAAFAASTIPGARLMRFERGGHLLFAVEQAAVSAAVQQQIRSHTSPSLTENH